MNADQQVLRMKCRKLYPCDEIPAPQSFVIAGHEFTLAYHIVNRKCFDNLPTPTMALKMDGNRVSYEKAIAALENRLPTLTSLISAQ